MYPLFESIRIENSVARNLSFHQERVNQSLRDLFTSSKQIPDLQRIIKVPPELGKATYKCRFLYNESEWLTEFTSYQPRKVATLKLIHFDDIDYRYKFTNRDIIDKAFTLKGTSDDVLIIKEGMITDTSIANILFKSENKWYTPALPLLHGTCRARLIAQGIVTEAEITLSNFRQYSHFMLINAMNDFKIKRIQPIGNIFI